MYIVVDKDNNKEFEHSDSNSAKERLVGLCSAGISAYIYIEKSYHFISKRELINNGFHIAKEGK